MPEAGSNQNLLELIGMATLAMESTTMMVASTQDWEVRLRSMYASMIAKIERNRRWGRGRIYVNAETSYCTSDHRMTLRHFVHTVSDQSSMFAVAVWRYPCCLSKKLA